MNAGIIAVRYAKALMEYAGEKALTRQVYAEMKQLAESFSREAALRRALDNPMLSARQKTDLLSAAAGGEVSEAFRDFAAMVVKNRREDQMQSIALMYLELYRKKNNISIGFLATATPVSPEATERMRRLIAAQTHGTVEFRTKVDPALLGGFVFEMDFKRLDASVAAQLRHIANQLKEKNKRIV